MNRANNIVTATMKPKRLVTLMTLVLISLAFSMRPVLSEEADFKKDEWTLLNAVAKEEKRFGPDASAVQDSLRLLKDLYKDHGRWDEYSAICERTLDTFMKANPDWLKDHHTLPGGPVPRIGVPGYRVEGQIPRSFLSRWLNRKTLPKLYAREEIDCDDYSKIYQKALTEAEKKREPLAQAQNLEGLANLYCAQAKFAQAEPLYVQALAVREKAFGPKHASLAYSLNNLAEVYRIEGKDTDADLLDRRAKTLH